MLRGEGAIPVRGMETAAQRFNYKRQVTGLERLNLLPQEEVFQHEDKVAVGRCEPVQDARDWDRKVRGKVLVEEELAVDDVGCGAPSGAPSDAPNGAGRPAHLHDHRWRCLSRSPVVGVVTGVTQAGTKRGIRQPLKALQGDRFDDPRMEQRAKPACAQIGF